MATYGGSFSLSNQTGAEISNVSGGHRASGQPEATVTAAALANNAETAETTFTTESSSIDHWTVSFVNSDGNVLRTGTKDCGFEEVDQDKAVVITLMADKFSILMPESGSCVDVSYDQT